VALALVRDVVERIVPHPKPEDLLAIRREALAAVVRLGADPASVDVTVEVDQQTHRVRAIAMGAAEMHVKDAGGGIAEREARSLAARSLAVAPDTLALTGATEGLRAYQPAGTGARPVRVIDWTGATRVQRSRALVTATTAAGALAALGDVWREAGGVAGASPHGHPGLVLLHGRHVVDLSGVEDLAQAQALAASETESLPQDSTIVLIAMPRDAAH
jgi:N-methylhydantoinase A